MPALPPGAREAAVSAPPSTDGAEPRGGARLRAKMPWFALAAACLAADLWSKWAVFYPLRPVGAKVGDVEILGHPLSWFAIRIAYNQGVTFGLASGTSIWLLALATGGVILLLLWQLWTIRVSERAKSLALAIIVGGAIGNLYDRTLRPHLELDTRPGVRDFLDWYAPDHWALAGWLEENVGTTHWYTSNVADVLIVCGVILLGWMIVTERAPDAGAAGEQAA